MAEDSKKSKNLSEKYATLDFLSGYRSWVIKKYIYIYSSWLILPLSGSGKGY